MGPQHGSFCWMELNARGVDKAKPFYHEMFGWEIRESKMPEMDYTEFGFPGDRPVGGMFELPAEMAGVPSHWIAYVAVDDVDASAAKVEGLGGKVEMPPYDIPTVGRFCIVSDPTGARLALITLAMTEAHKES